MAKPDTASNWACHRILTVLVPARYATDRGGAHPLWLFPSRAESASSRSSGTRGKNTSDVSLTTVLGPTPRGNATLSRGVGVWAGDAGQFHEVVLILVAFGESSENR